MARTAEVDGARAEIVEPEPLVRVPPRSLDDELRSLRDALNSYDDAKAAHRDTTEELTLCKKRVDTCARAVVEAAARENQPELPLE